MAATETALTTARQTLTAYELVAEVPWSLTLEEDAVIAMAAEVRSTLVRNAVEVIDDVLLNADTTAVNNINADGATISASEAGKGHWLLGFDGLLHLPLVGNATQGNSHGADPDAAMYNEVRGMLGKYGVRPSELAYVTDVSTYIKSLGIDEFRTLDKLGPQATILSGQLAQVDGIPVIVAEEMAKSDDDGKVTSGATNTKGRLLLVNRSQWRLGFRRELMIETTRGYSEAAEHHGGQYAAGLHGAHRQPRHRHRHPHRAAIQHHGVAGNLSGSVIASAARQSHGRSKGGSPASVRPHRDCHVAMLLAMTD